jgi:hypothetical protein
MRLRSPKGGRCPFHLGHEQTFADGVEATFGWFLCLKIRHSSAARYVAFKRMAQPRCHLLVILRGESQPLVESPPMAADSFVGVPRNAAFT